MEGISPEANLLLRSFCLIRYSLESALFYSGSSDTVASRHVSLRFTGEQTIREDAGGVSQRFLSSWRKNVAIVYHVSPYVQNVPRGRKEKESLSRSGDIPCYYAHYELSSFFCSSSCSRAYPLSG